MGLRRLASLVLLLSVEACARRAPSPEQCERLAMSWYGVGASVRQRVPEAELAVRELTLECLRRPFPRDFVRCVQELGRSPACRSYWQGEFGQLRQVP